MSISDAVDTVVTTRPISKDAGSPEPQQPPAVSADNNPIRHIAIPQQQSSDNIGSHSSPSASRQTGSLAGTDVHTSGQSANGTSLTLGAWIAEAFRSLWNKLRGDVEVLNSQGEVSPDVENWVTERLERLQAGNQLNVKIPVDDQLKASELQVLTENVLKRLKTMATTAENPQKFSQTSLRQPGQQPRQTMHGTPLVDRSPFRPIRLRLTEAWTKQFTQDMFVNAHLNRLFQQTMRYECQKTIRTEIRELKVSSDFPLLSADDWSNIESKLQEDYDGNGCASRNLRGVTPESQDVRDKAAKEAGQLQKQRLESQLRKLIADNPPSNDAMQEDAWSNEINTLIQVFREQLGNSQFSIAARQLELIESQLAREQRNQNIRIQVDALRNSDNCGVLADGDWNRLQRDLISEYDKQHIVCPTQENIRTTVLGKVEQCRRETLQSQRAKLEPYSRCVNAIWNARTRIDSARHTRLAASVSSQVFSDGRECATPAELLLLKSVIAGHEFGDTTHGRLVLRRLTELCDSGQLLTTLNSIQAPDPKNLLCDAIRAMLELPVNTVVTARHAREAVLSSLLSELRQSGAVSSCHGTAVAIEVHAEQPQRFLNNMKEMIETGLLSQQQAAPNTSPCRFPAQRGDLEMDFDEEINLDLGQPQQPNGETSISQPLPKQNLDEKRKVLSEAISKWYTGRDPETSSRPTTRPALEHTLKVMGLTPKDFGQAAADLVSGPAEGKVDLFLTELLDRALLNKYGFTKKQVEEMTQLVNDEAELRYQESAFGSLFQDVGDSKEFQAEPLKTELEKLQTLRKSVPKRLQEFHQLRKPWADYQQDKQRMWATMFSFRHNPLLRSFEYTLTNCGSQNFEIRMVTANLYSTISRIPHDYLKDGLSKDFARTVHVDKIRNLFKSDLAAELVNRFHQFVRLQYDPQLQYYDPDQKRYQKGGFCLINTHGKTSPYQWTKVRSQNDLQEMVLELLNVALDKALLKHALPEKDITAIRQWLCARTFSVLEDQSWDFQRGNNAGNVMSSYYNQKISEHSAKCESAGDIMNLLLDTVRKQHQQQLPGSDACLLNAIGGRPRHAFRILIPKSDNKSVKFFQAAIENPEMEPKEIASRIGMKDKDLIIFGDSNHGWGDDRTLYGFEYVNRSNHDKTKTVTVFRLVDINNRKPSSPGINFMGTWTIRSIPPVKSGQPAA